MYIEMIVICYFIIRNKAIGVYFVKYYKNLSVFFSLFLLLQYLVFTLAHYKLSGFLPGLPLYIESTEFESVVETEMYVAVHSMFTERSHFCAYVTPSLAMFIWNNKEKKRLLKICIVIVSVFLSTSSNGIIAVSFIIAFYLYKRFFTSIKIHYIVIGVMLLLGGVVFMLRSSYIQGVTYGLFVAPDGRPENENKAYARIYRGFLIYYSLPETEKLLGCGQRNADNCLKVKNSDAHSLLYIENFEYINSWAAILVYSGIVGFFLFGMYYYKVGKDIKEIEGRLIMIVVLMLMISSSVIMTEQWVLYLSIIYSFKNKEYETVNFYSSKNKQRNGYIA